jgi:hypothetical protein
VEVGGVRILVGVTAAVPTGGVTVLSARRAPARPRCCACATGWRSPPAGRCGSTAKTSRPSTRWRSGAGSGWFSSARRCSRAPSAPTCARPARRGTPPPSSPRSSGPGWTPGSSTARATTSPAVRPSGPASSSPSAPTARSRLGEFQQDRAALGRGPAFLAAARLRHRQPQPHP